MVSPERSGHHEERGATRVSLGGVLEHFTEVFTTYALSVPRGRVCAGQDPVMLVLSCVFSWQRSVFVFSSARRSPGSSTAESGGWVQVRRAAHLGQQVDAVPLGQSTIAGGRHDLRWRPSFFAARQLLATRPAPGGGRVRSHSMVMCTALRANPASASRNFHRRDCAGL
ncbi:hypothetical protein ACWDUL_20780 [Nocardia niigatensis]